MAATPISSLRKWQKIWRCLKNVGLNETNYYRLCATWTEKVDNKLRLRRRLRTSEVPQPHSALPGLIDSLGSSISWQTPCHLKFSTGKPSPYLAPISLGHPLPLPSSLSCSYADLATVAYPLGLIFSAFQVIGANLPDKQTQNRLGANDGNC